jgi:hypothetical protein
MAEPRQNTKEYMKITRLIRGNLLPKVQQCKRVDNTFSDMALKDALSV